MSGRRRWGILATALLVVAAVACGADTNDRTGKARTDTVDEQGLRRTLSHRYGWQPDEIDVDLGPDVPGMLLFTASSSAEPRTHVTGVYDGEISLGLEPNRDRVLRALGFGTATSAPPEHIAAAIGLLEENPGAPFLDPFVIEHSIAADRIGLPRAITVDGRPAVEYWNSSARLSPWKTVLVARADGSFDYRREPI